MANMKKNTRPRTGVFFNNFMSFSVISAHKIWRQIILNIRNELNIRHKHMKIKWVSDMPDVCWYNSQEKSHTQTGRDL